MYRLSNASVVRRSVAAFDGNKRSICSVPKSWSPGSEVEGRLLLHGSGHLLFVGDLLLKHHGTIGASLLVSEIDTFANARISIDVNNLVVGCLLHEFMGPASS
jgi:hypothetical protein